MAIILLTGRFEYGRIISVLYLREKPFETFGVICVVAGIPMSLSQQDIELHGSACFFDI